MPVDLENDDLYAVWEAKLKGQTDIDQSLYVQTVFDEDTWENPQPGFWRRKGYPKGSPDQAIAIFLDEDANLIATVDARREITDPMDICEKVWRFCMEKPITKEIYDSVCDGENWPDDPGLGHNVADVDDEFDVLKDQIENAIKVAKSYKDIDDKDTADKAANTRDRLNELKKVTEEQRKERKKPHDDAGKAVQARYKPLIERIEEAAKKVREDLTPYLRKLEIAEMEKALEAAKQESQEVEVEASATPKAPTEAPKARVGGASGRRTTLRDYKTYTIEDYEKVLAAVKDDDDVKDAVLKVARRRAVAGVKIPGLKITVEKRAT